MEILPVIDLKGGQVVRGVAGRRDEYRPIVSKLCGDAIPANVARAFVEKLGAKQVYVADLDALAGAEPDWPALAEIAAAGLSLWLDCGMGDVRRANSVTEHASWHGTLAAVIVPLEAADSPQTLTRLLAAIGSERAVFSLDLFGGKPFTTRPIWCEKSPADIAHLAIDIGFQRLVVIDLAQVGTGQGPSVVPLCRELRRSHPVLELAAGGGVRGPDDLALFAAGGCDYALVASALHDGRVETLTN